MFDQKREEFREEVFNFLKEHLKIKVKSSLSKYGSGVGFKESHTISIVLEGQEITRAVIEQ